MPDLTTIQSSVLRDIGRGDRREPSHQVSAYTVAERTGLPIERVEAAVAELSALGYVGGRYVGGVSGHLYSPTFIPSGEVAKLLADVVTEEDGRLYHPDRALAKPLLRWGYVRRYGDFAIEATDAGRKVLELVG